MIAALTSLLDRIQSDRWQRDQITRIEIEHDLRKLVADHYLGWGKAQVPADYDGKHASWVYVQNGILPPGYTFPPKGAISPYLFTPQFAVLSPGDDLDRLRSILPLAGLMITQERHDGQVSAMFRSVIRRSGQVSTPLDFCGSGTHRSEHIARLLAVLYAHLYMEMSDVIRRSADT